MTDGGSSIPEVHALLATLVASKPAGRFAETGTARWQCRSCQVLRAEVVHGHWLDVSLSRHRGSATELGLPAEERRNHRPIGVIGQLAAAEVATARQAAEPLPSYANGPTI